MISSSFRDVAIRTRLFLRALLGLAIVWPVPALAQESRAGASWVADFGDTMCSLSRSVGPEAATVFRLEWGAGAEVPGLLIGNPTWKQDLVQSEQPAVLILQPSGTRVAARAFPLSSPIRRARGVSLYQLDSGFLEALSSATGLIVEAGGRRLIEVALPQTAAAVKTLRSCNSSLMQAMGLDPAFMAMLRSRPKPVGGSVARWVSNGDYPSDALRRDASGTATVRLTIGIDGRVQDCTIAASSGDASLDRATCAIIQRRGRFEPAIGADGNPVAAPLVTSLRWFTAPR
ncbi:MAG TPA: energy transducer TonB [Allosphingosinicella sp.]|jgi:TonB family protein